MVFPVVKYGCESWTIKIGEPWRTDAFEVWSWGRLLRVPWTARRSNLSMLKEISPEYSWKDWCWSWNSNTLPIWCKEVTHWKRPWCWKRLKAGGEEHDRGWDDWIASLTWWTWVWANSGGWWWTGKPDVLQSRGPHGLDLTEWTELNQRIPCFPQFKQQLHIVSDLFVFLSDSRLQVVRDHIFSIRLKSD